MDSVDDTAEAVGCPIRKSTDQSLLAAPRGLSQRAASFIASQCQGIHQMPFRRLISFSCAPRAGESPQRPRPPERIRSRCITDPTANRSSSERPTCPQTHPAKMHHHDPTDCLPTAKATALSGHPRSLILFTCQRSHTRSQADICFLSRGYLDARSLNVTQGHCPT